MKAQRYSTTACDDEFIEDPKGEWMLSDDGDKLEAKIDALRGLQNSDTQQIGSLAVERDAATSMVKSLRVEVEALQEDLYWLYNSSEEEGKRVADYGGLDSPCTLPAAIRAAREATNE